MNIEAYDAESLRKLVRTREYENRILKDKLKKEKDKDGNDINKWSGLSIDFIAMEPQRT